ncbi:MAG: hypothetical protein EA339_08290 [Rhodobacteraceae bacterium]|nr:MAG: hypothetical protein EA339_08290 [Paracoccaceae bacterium]
MICVGATKAGTSWLYAYLRRHPDCWLRSIKELHYFNTVQNDSFDDQITQRQAELARLQARGDAPRLLARQRDLRDWLTVLGARGADDDAAYRAYLHEGRSAQRVVGDVTPAYGLLSVAMLRRIATLGADVRMVYLLRDPVERLWSQLRMNARRRIKDPAEYERKALKLMDAALAGGEERAVIRGDYAGAVTRLDAAVEPQSLLIMFQDELMSRSGLERLTSFLGISARKFDTERRVHEGAYVPLDAARHARAVELLRPQYDFIAERFGALPPRWQRNLQVGVLT